MVHEPSALGWNAHSAIVAQKQGGDLEEATWLAFLTVAIGGRGGQDPWRAVRFTYSGFGLHPLRWSAVRDDQQPIIESITRSNWTRAELMFGNHRKFESPERLVKTLVTYAEAVREHGSQRAWLAESHLGDPARFSRLMADLGAVSRFGRLARYDFLTLLWSLDLFDLVPDGVHLDGATGPLRGARRVFGSSLAIGELERETVELASELRVTYPALEDALCNWQKH